MVNGSIDSIISPIPSGVPQDSHLKFDSHIAETSSLAILRCSQLLKSFRSRSLPLYKHLFNTYVLPVLVFQF
ncbi:hypothetical protein CRE_23183 [Caenorhabditis remanei]|uniref:Uncharacterized protein n=1 Tax=Caenorhabditis remanei TaxID=31234 RepID=E3NJX0_CAERE|nr:hypothetical protein CRE_23183 [Caenorhabditis remanei]